MAKKSMRSSSLNFSRPRCRSVVYEPAIWLRSTVGNDYLVSDGKNKYSVPFDLIGEKVQIRLTRNVVEVFFKGCRITSHERLAFCRMKPVIKTNHMPDNHKKYLNYNADEFMKWSKDTGKSVADVIERFLSTGSDPECCVPPNENCPLCAYA